MRQYMALRRTLLVGAVDRPVLPTMVAGGADSLLAGIAVGG